MPDRPHMRRKSPELVHGLSAKVELKDWDFAYIQAALKLYRKHNPKKRAYVDQLMRKLSLHFVYLVKDTKRLNHSLRAAQTAVPLDEFKE